MCVIKDYIALPYKCRSNKEKILCVGRGYD
jgi:hypothetical protein